MCLEWDELLLVGALVEDENSEIIGKAAFMLFVDHCENFQLFLKEARSIAGFWEEDWHAQIYFLWYDPGCWIENRM